MAKKILVVDDDPIVSDCIKDILEQEGHEVTLAASGREGLSKAESTHPDLIITDYIMDDISGGALARFLGSNKKTAAIPLIFVTTLFDENEAEFTKHKLGSHEFLPKPIQREELIALVAKMLSS